MRHWRSCPALLIGLFAGGLLLAGPAFGGRIILDDFNRPDGSDMGPNWIEQAGDFGITSGRASGANGSLMTFVGATSNRVSVDAFPSSSLSYVAIVLGYADLDNCLFMKVQNQGATLFNFAAFYHGNNVGSQFFPLSSPFASARMTASLIGGVAYLEFDTDFDGTPEQTYSYSGYSLGSLGTGIGLGSWGWATMDNFAIETEAIPEPGTAALLGPALAGLALALRRRRRG